MTVKDTHTKQAPRCGGFIFAQQYPIGYEHIQLYRRIEPISCSISNAIAHTLNFDSSGCTAQHLTLVS